MGIDHEAWLGGPLEAVLPQLMPAAHALVQAAEDIHKAAGALTTSQVWTKPHGAPSVGFHLRHIAGSMDRLLTYARGETLDPAQLAALAAESAPDEAVVVAAPQLVAAAIGRIEQALVAIRLTPEETLFAARVVGRAQLPTSVFGLLFHIAEHTQRHVGQIVTTAHIVRACHLQRSVNREGATLEECKT